MNRRKSPVAAVIGSLFASVCIVAAVWAWRESARAYREFAAWETAEPMKVQVDFSARGEYRGKFHQTCSVSHGEIIELRVSPPFESDEVAQTAMEGLGARIRIMTADGEEMLNDSLEAGGMHPAREGSVLLLRFTPFTIGQYEYVVQITQPVRGVEGREQQLAARYLLCGCERIPASLCRGLAYIALGAGVLVGLLSVWPMWGTVTRCRSSAFRRG